LVQVSLSVQGGASSEVLAPTCWREEETQDRRRLEIDEMPQKFQRVNGGDDDNSDEDMSTVGDSTDAEYNDRIKGSDPSCLPVCCTAACCCHWCYIFLFLSYLVVFPLWCKWLLTAPMPFPYWFDKYPNFPRMTMLESTVGWNSAPNQIIMSDIPTGGSACNSTCAVELHGYRTSEMNFDVTLQLNRPDLSSKEALVHVAYPVLFVSEDFEHWQLAADRRNSYPTPFFGDMGGADDRKYVSVQEACSRTPSSTGIDSLTSQHQFIIGCVTWNGANSAKLKAIEGDTEIDNTELSEMCDYVGGVCGWPCMSDIPTLHRLENCDANGRIDDAAIRAAVYGNQTPPTATSPRVSVKACTDPLSAHCTTDIEDMSSWQCHQCERDPAEARRLQAGLPSLPGVLGPLPGTGVVSPTAPSMDPIGTDSDSDTDSSAEATTQTWRSLPRLRVELERAVVPDGSDMLSTPRAYILSGSSVQGPWKKVYPPMDANSDWEAPKPVGAPENYENTAQQIMGDELRAMTLHSSNRLSMHPTSCFGKRGPKYIVACAVNGSIYDQKNQWQNGSDPRFHLGQAVSPPPFNDRCVAVAGKCGFACESSQSDLSTLPHCLPDGNINQSMLVGAVEPVDNRKTPVFLFVFVLLFGFSVKTIMLCPGIFAPYKRCHYYDPELTEQLRYILVVGVTGGGDEGKGTMLRNTVGMVSGLPPECRCRFIVCNNEEGHRMEMMTCWERFCAVISAVPHSGGFSYEDNLRKFTHIWCEETKNMRLKQVGGKVKELDPKIAERLSGKTALAKAKNSLGWLQLYGEPAMTRFQQAIEALHVDLTTNYNKFTPMTPNEDFVRDWLPPDPNSTSLRMHFTSRAKPFEDPRNIMVQHVAVGTWYYKVPPDATSEQWLELRKKCQEMVYATPDEDGVSVKVPLRSSHGKAGGLNFVDNYISIVNNRPENLYNNEADQDNAPSLYAIADARHQYQPDFMISCVPCFFDEDGNLNHRVGFTQAPQHYPEYADKADYLDNNNAQFFRLNAMIRNCCGGVSSCGTNGMWQLPHRPGDRDTIWNRRMKRVRDRDHRLRTELIEREQFHTSCKIEDTASSLDRVLQGEYSHFVNRKLSYGMSKDPEGFLGAQQRWVEGAITLFWQWTTGNADAEGESKRNGYYLWLVILGFIGFVAALIRLVCVRYTSSIFVEMGMVSPEQFKKMVQDPIRGPLHTAYNYLMMLRGGHSPDNYNYQEYEDMTAQFLIFVLTCVGVYFALWLFTLSCSLCQRCIKFPNEMKWWGRLLISFDNLTYWVWFWTSFFWIGFNFYLATFPSTFHFNNLGMMSFMLVTTILNYALIISNSMRFSIMESVDANEVAFLSMDNIWRANQLFFMVGPIQGFSVITGTKNFMNYLFYGQDIGGWAGGDLTQVSIMIVKYWTSAIIIGAISCWIYLFTSHPTDTEYQSRRPGCIIFTFIALDVLHPCVYLWTVGNNLSDEEASKMTWCQALTDKRWWKRVIANTVLTEGLTNIFRYIAPAYNFMLPILVLYQASFGAAAGFTLVAVGAGH